MQVIEHVGYGRGIVQRTGLGGFELHVKFEDGVSRWVRYDEIRFLSDSPLLTKSEIRKPVLLEKQFEARQIIESLKLGVVPYNRIEEFTFGRDKEISRIENWLVDSEGGSLILSGEYGVGKTHFLEYVYSMALGNGWAVSMVQLDPNELPLHKPKTIYEYIIHSFRFRNQNGDFREFLREIARGPEFYKLKKHSYLGKMVEMIRTDDESDDIWEWIEGKPTKSYRPLMYQPATCANIYCHILSGIGWAAKNILGLNGFLILFDEAESVDPFWFSAYQNNKGWNFLKGLVLMSKNDPNLLDEYRDRKIYSYKTYTGQWGQYTGLQYCGRSRLPFTWKTPCHLKTLFAFTPSGEVFRRAPLNNIEKYKIKHIGTEYLTNVSERIVALHNTAYDFQINADIFEHIPKDNTRKFIKGLIEALDLICSHPDKSIDELLGRHVEGGELKSREDSSKRFYEQHIEDEGELDEELTYEEMLENMRAGAAALAKEGTISNKLREMNIREWFCYARIQIDILDRHPELGLTISGRIWGKLGSLGLKRDEIESYIMDKGYQYGEIRKYIKEHRDELLNPREDLLKRFHEQHIEDEDELEEELTEEGMLENMRAGAAALADDETVAGELVWAKLQKLPNRSEIDRNFAKEVCLMRKGSQVSKFTYQCEDDVIGYLQAVYAHLRVDQTHTDEYSDMMLNALISNIAAVPRGFDYAALYKEMAMQVDHDCADDTSAAGTQRSLDGDSETEQIDTYNQFYEQHIKKHNVTTCWICGKSFSGPPQVMSHAIGKHTDWRSGEYLECPICGEKIKR